MCSLYFKAGQEARISRLAEAYNPFHPGTPARAEWSRGWHQEDLDCHDVVRSSNHGVSR
jgi:hypothetical protein